MKWILLVVIRVYQRILSPDHGVPRVFYPYGYCKFHPTCSQYAYEAVHRYGSITGAWLATKRLLRCHPWSKGGEDPVR